MKPTSVGLLTIKIFSPLSNQLIGFSLIVQRTKIKLKLKAHGQAFFVFLLRSDVGCKAVRRLSDREAAAKGARVTMGHFDVVRKFMFYDNCRNSRTLIGYLIFIVCGSTRLLSAIASWMHSYFDNVKVV